MNTYKYTYQDWVEGKITLDSGELDRLGRNRELSTDDIHTIGDKQREAYEQYLYWELNFAAYDFLSRYQESLVPDYTLEDEASRTKEQVESFKSEYPTIYRDVLSGQDGRHKLTYQQVVNCTNGSLEQTSCTDKHTGLIIKLIYLEWLLWIEKADKKGLKNDFKTFVRERKEKYKGLDYEETIRLRRLAQKRPKHEPNSYVWQGRQEEINTLYNHLIVGEFLPDNTSFEIFKAVFTGKPLNSIQPLQWLKAKNLLAYLIDQLNEANKLPNNINIWDVALNCFSDGKYLVQLRTNYEGNSNQKPKGFRAIDNIIASLK